MEDLLEGTAEGRLEEELGELEVAEAEVAIGSGFLRGVVLLLFLLSDVRASSSSRRKQAYLRPPESVICLAFPTYL